jgi:rhodanese-related sulfurtransferase
MAYTDLNVSDFATKIKSKNIQLIDVRTASEVACGQIEDAINIDVYDPQFMEKIAALPKDKMTLVYCLSGGRSGMACSMLARQCVKEIYNLTGGLGAWIANKRPTV